MNAVLSYEVSELDKRLLSGVRSARVGIREGLLIEFLHSGRDIARIELPTEKEAGTLYNSLRVAALRKGHPVRLVRRHTMVFLVRTLEAQSPKKHS